MQKGLIFISHPPLLSTFVTFDITILKYQTVTSIYLSNSTDGLTRMTVVGTQHYVESER